MKLLLDANLSWRLTKALLLHFEEVKHILDFFPHDIDDLSIWELARKENFLIITNDEDFVSLIGLRGWPPKVVLLKTGNWNCNKIPDNIIKQLIIGFYIFL